LKTLCSGLDRLQSCRLYGEVLKSGDTTALRRLCKEDLFFLILIACQRKDINKGWVYDRCREVEADSDGYLDLWAREHYKSTLITFGKSIQDILNNPEITIGIFSHTRPIAKSFLVQIKREFEINTFLQDLFPDVLYANPQKTSPKWSLDDGIIVKRKGNPKESTIEAWGLVDGQPTSKHFQVLVYDDLVTKESVTTPEMIHKVTEAWELSLNLAGQNCKKRHIGTRYHSNDTYKTIIDRNAAIPRIYPATDNGKLNGKPVLLTQAQFDEKIRDMGSYVAGAQLLLNPLADNEMGFKTEWIMNYDFLTNHEKWNYYILADPASKKKQTNDYTVMAVIGLAPDQNYYLVDGIRDRLNLTERTKKLFELHRKWHPKNSGYEEYGLSCDIEHIKYVQEQEGYRFLITPIGGSIGKNDRIRRLVPIFEQRRFRLPHQLLFRSVDGKVHDFIKEFISDEYSTFPVCSHDDMLDCISRIVEPDLHTRFPQQTSSPIQTHAVSDFNLFNN
jgi:predicted phage terminase large subunit-like protein